MGKIKNPIFSIRGLIKRHKRGMLVWLSWAIVSAPTIVLSVLLVGNKSCGWFHLDICNEGANSLVSVSAAFPLMLTAISIAISLSEEKICGIKKKDFANARNGMSFSMMSMLYCSVSIMAIFDASCLLDDLVVAIVCDCLSAVFSLVFGFLEIPLLMKNKKVIFGVVKRMTRNDADEISISIGIKAVKNMLVDENIGLMETFINTWDKHHGSKAEYFSQLLVWQKEIIKNLANSSKYESK
jgi:hypothetical protein